MPRASTLLVCAALVAGCGGAHARSGKTESAAGPGKPTCKAGASEYRICVGPPARGHHGRASIERLTAGGWQEVAGPVGYQPRGSWVGRWVSIAVSPDGRTLLAQWSGECESATAFFVPAEGGRPRTVTGERDLSKTPESYAKGWTKDGRARVRLPAGPACGLGADRPGIYLIDPETGDTTLERALLLPKPVRTIDGDCQSEGRYRLCTDFTKRELHSTIELQLEDGRRRLIAGPPLPERGPGVNGLWKRAILSPDGSMLLAEWAHACDKAHAFFIPAQGGRPRAVTGQSSWRKAPVSYPLGWTRDGRARVRVLPFGDCRDGPYGRPGIYLIDPKTGRRTFVRQLSWGELTVT